MWMELAEDGITETIAKRGKDWRFVEDVVEKKKTAAAAEVQEIERRLIGCL